MPPRRRFNGIPNLPKGRVSLSSIMEKLKSFIGGTGTGFSPPPRPREQQPMLPEGYFPHLQNRGVMPAPKPPDLSKVVEALSKQVSGIQKNMAVNLLGKLKLQPLPQGTPESPPGIPGMTGTMGGANPLAKMNLGQVGTLAEKGDPEAIKRLVQELTDKAKKDLDAMKKKMEGLSEGGKAFFRAGVDLAEGAAPGLGAAVEGGFGGIGRGARMGGGVMAAGQSVAGMGGAGAGAAGGAIMAAGAVAGVATGAAAASVALLKWAHSLAASNMDLSRFSVSMSRVALEHNIRQMRMDREQGNALASSTRRLSEAVDSFQQDLLPIKVGVKEAVGGLLTDFVNGLRVIKNQTFELGKADAERRKGAKSQELDIDKVIKGLGVEKWHQQYGRPSRFSSGGVGEIGMPGGGDF